MQTSRPDKRRSLPNHHLDVRNEHLGAQPAGDFRLVRGLEEQLQRFDEVGPCGLDGVALARDVELRAECDVRVVFPLDNRSQVAGGL